MFVCVFFFQAEDGIRDLVRSRGLGDVYKRQGSETDVAIFSLHAVKNVTTAEGGAICLNMPENIFDNAVLHLSLIHI